MAALAPSDAALVGNQKDVRRRRPGNKRMQSTVCDDEWVAAKLAAFFFIQRSNATAGRPYAGVRRFNAFVE